MRAVVFFVCLCLLLLCGGNTVYAGTQHSSSNSHSSHSPAKRQHAKLTNTNQDNSILDDADLDVDEDYLRGHDADDGHINTFLAERNSMPDKWYLNFSPLFNLDFCNKRFKAFPPFCGDVSPIYIKQRVLKI